MKSKHTGGTRQERQWRRSLGFYVFYGNGGQTFNLNEWKINENNSQNSKDNHSNIFIRALQKMKTKSNNPDL